MDRRTFLASGLAAMTINPMSASQGHARSKEFQLDETTIAELQDRMHRGHLSAERITHLYLERIAELDHDGPTVKAVIETNPEALSIARALDRERREGRVRGPLHGVPVLLKDNID